MIKFERFINDYIVQVQTYCYLNMIGKLLLTDDIKFHSDLVYIGIKRIVVHGE